MCAMFKDSRVQRFQEALLEVFSQVLPSVNTGVKINLFPDAQRGRLIHQTMCASF
jgi:hypothetical protein